MTKEMRGFYTALRVGIRALYSIQLSKNDRFFYFIFVLFLFLILLRFVLFSSRFLLAGGGIFFACFVLFCFVSFFFFPFLFFVCFCFLLVGVVCLFCLVICFVCLFFTNNFCSFVHSKYMYFLFNSQAL